MMTILLNEKGSSWRKTEIRGNEDNWTFNIYTHLFRNGNAAALVCVLSK